MSEKPISPLRRRMIEDMTVRNFVEKTRMGIHMVAIAAEFGRGFTANARAGTSTIFDLKTLARRRAASRNSVLERC